MFLLSTTFALVLGLYFGRNNIVISVLVSLAYLCFVLYRFGKRKFLIVILLFGLGIIVPKITFAPSKGPDYGGYVIDVRDNYYLFESKLNRYYVYAKDNEFEVGDRLIIKGKVTDFKFNTYESQFDFKQYLKNKGVTKELVAYETNVKAKSILRLHKLKYKVLSRYDENTATLISAFLFNDKDYSKSVIKIASEQNLIFLFSLSGVYLNVLFALANRLLFLKFDKKKSRIFTFVIFLPFAIFSFTKIGVLRVYGLYVLKYLNEYKFKRRKFIHIELVSILALIFLIIDYHLVYQESFYIGFLLSMFSAFILSSTKFISKRWKRYIINTLMFSVVMLPIRVSNGYITPFYFLEHLIVLPVTFFFLIIAMVSIIIPIKFPVLYIGKAVTWILEKMDTSFSLRIPFGNWGGTFSYLFLIVFLWLVFYLESVRVRHAKIAVVCLAIMTTISMVPLQEPVSNAVYFINVGQGDSILIKNKNHTVMIDTGGQKSFDIATETLIPFMNKKKVTHIDALILTHDDFDHSGGKDSLVKNFKVKNVLTEQSQFPYKIGDLNIENLNTFEFEEENDKSLVLYLEFMKKKWLFTGDASVKTEEKILEKYDVDCDILKVGHHGSKTSSSEKFIKATSPTEAIISCGGKNSYNHPDQEIVDRLNKYNIKIRRTDEEGTICFFH